MKNVNALQLSSTFHAKSGLLSLRKPPGAFCVWRVYYMYSSRKYRRNPQPRPPRLTRAAAQGSARAAISHVRVLFFWQNSRVARVMRMGCRALVGAVCALSDRLRARDPVSAGLVS